MNKRDKTTEFVEKARRVHGDKYSYPKVNYINIKTKVIITCSKHGEFEQRPREHFRGQGCSKCKGEKLSDRYRGTKDEFIIKAKKVHGEKYCYDHVNYVQRHKKVVIICPKHGKFEQTPSAHLQGCDCSKCGEERRVKKRTKWNYEACKTESRKYKTRNYFRKGNGSAYNASLRNGWLDDFYPNKKNNK